MTERQVLLGLLLLLLMIWARYHRRLNVAQRRDAKSVEEAQLRSGD